MLDVPQIHSIRTLHLRGFSERAIAKMLGVNRRTVHRYLTEEEVVEPQRRMRLKKPRPSPKMDPWKAIVAQWVEEDRSVPRKQRRTARRIYQELRRLYDADISEATVRRYVAKLKAEQARRAYVPLEFRLGEMAEADFGHAEAVIGGERRLWPFFALQLMASRVRFCMLLPNEKLESLMAGLVAGLEFLGGVPEKILFDNASTMVYKVLSGGRRLLTPEFQALCAHYRFVAEFANPGAGNEKGGVESLVGWAQRNLFSPIPEARSFAEMNARLRQRLLEHAATTKLSDGTRIQERWEAEQQVLTPLPQRPFPACRTRFVRVDKMLLCQYDGARYSVPPQYVGKALTLKAFWDHIELEDRGTRVALHVRQPKGGVSLELEHYLPVLVHKPRAVRHAMVIARSEPEIARYRDAFLAARPEAYRELIAILRLAETIGLAALRTALQAARRHHAYDLESVRALHLMQSEPPPPSPLPGGCPGVPDVEVPQKRSAEYDALIQPRNKEVSS
jgi:transposase